VKLTESEQQRPSPFNSAIANHGAAGVPFKCQLSVYNSAASIGPENFFHHGTEISKHSMKALGRLQCHSAWFRIQDRSTGSES
jgi:hypothetical protein